MTDTEQRFSLSMRQSDSDEPGLIRERDGTVWVVNPDGTRTQLPGSGSGVPDGGSTGEVLTKASNADGDADWAANGGSRPITRGGYSLSVAAAAPNGSRAMTFAADYGDALLDLTAPENPLAIMSGIYAVTFNLFSSTDTVALKTMAATLAMDDLNNLGLVSSSGPLSAGTGQFGVAVSCTYYLDAAIPLAAYVRHNDVSNHDFAGEFVIQRLS